MRRVHAHQGGRSPRLRARSGQPDPRLSSGEEIQSGVPSGRVAARHALAQADRFEPAGERGGEPPLPRNPHLEECSPDRAAPHERDRPAPPPHAPLRPPPSPEPLQPAHPLPSPPPPPSPHLP